MPLTPETGLEQKGGQTPVLRKIDTVLNKVRARLPSKQTIASAALAGSLFITAACDSSSKENPEAFATSTTGTEEPVSKPTPAKENPKPTVESGYTYLVGGNVIVAVDAQGLPTKYKLPDGKEVSFDAESVKAARERALSLKEPEIVKRIETKFDSQKPPVPTKEHPRIPELPTGVLSEQELERRGVKITQVDSTKLYIRQNAFSSGGPLEAFNNTGRKLKIVLVDGPVVTSSFLKDSRYDDVRFRLKPQDQDISKYRTGKIAASEKELQDIREQLRLARESKQDSIRIESLESAILFVKDDIYAYKEVLTDDQLFLQMSKSLSDVAGQYFAPLSYANGQIEPGTAVIFVAVGGSDIATRNIEVFFDSRGVAQVQDSRAGFTSSSGLKPDQKQTHPNPKDFRTNPNASPSIPQSYPS